MPALSDLESIKAVPLWAAAGAVGGLYFVYILGTCFYNVYLHPLRHIPGSKLAVMGPYLEFYHEVIRKGQYLWEIEKMHEKYGRR